MAKINSEESLREAIAALEARHATEQAALKAELQRAYRSLRPASLIKGAYEEFVSSRDVQGEMIDVAIGLTANYVSKKIIEHIPDSDTATEATGHTLLAGLADAIRRHPEVVRTAGQVVFQMMRDAAQDGEE
jgi:hypothetical protein